MPENIKGHVVLVKGDTVRVAFKDEDVKYVCRRGKFLKITTRDGQKLVGMVSSMELVDELYKQARSMSMFPEQYENFILRRNDVLVTILGTLTENGVDRKIYSAPMPGDPVELLTKEELERIFSGVERQSRERRFIKIGTLLHEPEVAVSIDLNQIATKHVAILAMTGAGKSNTLATIITRIMAKLPSARIILIDTHSEYVGLANLAKNKNKKINVSIFCPVGRFRDILAKNEDIKEYIRNLEIPYWWLNIEEWYSLLRLTPQASNQRRILRTALRKLKGEKLDAPVYFDIESNQGGLIAAIKSTKNKSADSLIDKIDDVVASEEYEFIFKPEESKKLKDKPKEVFRKVLEPILSPGLKIIALGGIPAEVQTAVVSMLLRTLFRVAIEAKLKGRVIPTIVAIEEAHIYAPSEASAPSRLIIERIAKEGRKFGIGLIIVSQRPKELSSTVLAQCGTLITLRIRNPSDQNYILESVEDMTWYMIQSLSGLGVGEALISGFAVPIPCMVKVDAFTDVVKEEFNIQELRLGGRDINVAKEWSREITQEELKALIDKLYEGYEIEKTQQETKKEAKTPGLDIFMKR